MDLKDKQFGKWKVLHKANKRRYWTCKCECGTIKDVMDYHLVHGKSKSCGCGRLTGEELKGKKFGELLVINEEEPGIWKCECSCGTVLLVRERSLKRGIIKSCGCKIYNHGKLTGKLVGKRVGYLNVLDYELDYYTCECICKKIIRVHNSNLLSGNTTSCGCMKYKTSLFTRLANGTQRSKTNEQIDALLDKDAMKSYIESFEYAPTLTELAELFNMKREALEDRLETFGLMHLLASRSKASSIEKKIYDLLESNGVNYIVNDRSVLTGKELDIYIPYKKLAIEINGDYWHSNLFKEVNYHQNKTIACAKQGIRLIHLWEHELKNNEAFEKICKYLLFEIGCIERTQKLVHKKYMITEGDASRILDNYSIDNIGKDKQDIISINNVASMKFTILGNICYIESYVSLYKDSVKILRNFINYIEMHYMIVKIVVMVNLDKFYGNTYASAGFTVSNITEPCIVKRSAAYVVYGSGYLEMALEI